MIFLFLYNLTKVRIDRIQAGERSKMICFKRRMDRTVDLKKRKSGWIGREGFRNSHVKDIKRPFR